MNKNQITMSLIGRYGRFANCHFQAMFLRCYSMLHDLTPQAPMFPGQEIFDFCFDPVSRTLPAREEQYTKPLDCNSPTIPPKSDEFVNHDFRGYAQWNTSWYVPYKKELQAMFTPRTSLGLNNKHKSTRIGIHWRGGDYNNITNKWRCPIQWYLKWLDINWQDFDYPELYAICEDPRIVEKFRHYDPVTAADLGLKSTFTTDWMILRECDIMLCPNSTFSFTAAMMNPSLKESWRASLLHGDFIKFDPWNTTPLLYDRCEDYTGQIKLDSL